MFLCCLVIYTQRLQITIIFKQNEFTETISVKILKPMCIFIGYTEGSEEDSCPHMDLSIYSNKKSYWVKYKKLRKICSIQG